MLLSDRHCNRKKQSDIRRAGNVIHCGLTSESSTLLAKTEYTSFKHPYYFIDDNHILGGAV